MREEIAKLECLSGWVTLHRLAYEFELRVWSKDNGGDIEQFDLSDDGARSALDRFSARCYEILKELRP